MSPWAAEGEGDRVSARARFARRSAGEQTVADAHDAAYTVAMRTLLPFALALIMIPLAPQDPSAPSAKAAAPAETKAAQQSDVESVDAIVSAVFHVISGPKGKARDWDRMRSLFHQDGRLVAMVRGKDGLRSSLMKVDDYVARSGAALERDGFFEQELARQVHEHGDLAQVWSTYECRRALDDAKPFLRGIDAFTLVREKGRWWVLSLVWEQEADSGELPAKYLPAK